MGIGLTTYTVQYSLGIPLKHTPTDEVEGLLHIGMYILK